MVPRISLREAISLMAGSVQDCKHTVLRDSLFISISPHHITRSPTTPSTIRYSTALQVKMAIVLRVITALALVTSATAADLPTWFVDPYPTALQQIIAAEPTSTRLVVQDGQPGTALVKKDQLQEAPQYKIVPRDCDGKHTPRLPPLHASPGLARSCFQVGSRYEC